MITQLYTAFGWNIHRVCVDAGETFDIYVARETALHRLSAQTIYTKGRITGHYADDSSRSALVRGPGFGTDNLPNPLPALHLNMTAQEPAEWWCISALSNPSLPAVSFLRLQPGESEAISAGSLVFVCDGQAQANGANITGPMAVRVQNPTTLVAGGAAVYGMIFDRENAAT